MEQKERDIQALIECINNELETNLIHSYFVYFNPNRNTFLYELGFDKEYLVKLLNICDKRGLLDVQYNYCNDCFRINITPTGKDKALAGDNKEKISHINLTFNGPTQIGNGNVQNFSNFISTIEAQIDEAHASDAEKKEAKTLLVKLSENPLVSSIIGGLISSLG